MVIRSTTPLKPSFSPMGSWMGTALTPTRSRMPATVSSQAACSLFMRLTTMKLGMSLARSRRQMLSEATSKPPSALTTKIAPSITSRLA